MGRSDLLSMVSLLTLTEGSPFPVVKLSPLNTDPIAEVEQLVEIPVGLADTFFVEVNLDAAFDVTDGGEDGLAHVADSEQSACDGDCLLVCEVSLEFARGGGGVEFCSETGQFRVREFCQAFHAGRR